MISLTLPDTLPTKSPSNRFADTISEKYAALPTVKVPVNATLPVNEMFPVPYILCWFKFKFPPKCGLTSSST